MRSNSPKRSDGGLNENGRVTLVGAGPGDADLLTLKAVKALQSADVILFDALVSDEIFVSPAAKLSACSLASAATALHAAKMTSTRSC